MAHHFYAGVAELADALDLGSSELALVGVQIPSPAPIFVMSLGSKDNTPAEVLFYRSGF